MSAPRYVECRCSHGKADHEREGFAPQCTHTGCTCLQYRPKTAPDRPTGTGAVVPMTPPVVGPTAEQLIAAGKRSDRKRTVAQATKIESLLTALRETLRDEQKAAEAKRQAEAAKAAARAEVERLERELAAAKAKLAGRSPSTSTVRTVTVSRGEFQCPDCPKVTDTAQGLGAHRAKAHGYRRAS